MKISTSPLQNKPPCDSARRAQVAAGCCTDTVSPRISGQIIQNRLSQCNTAFRFCHHYIQLCVATLITDTAVFAMHFAYLYAAAMSGATCVPCCLMKEPKTIALPESSVFCSDDSTASNRCVVLMTSSTDSLARSLQYRTAILVLQNNDSGKGDTF